MKGLGSEVAGHGESSQQTSPKTTNPIVRTGRPVSTEQTFSSSLAARTPMKEQGDLFSSCVPVSVERADKDKDADENVYADQVRTVRPVLIKQREEIDIDFRVSGLPHAVVKQAENFSVRELVKKIESHPHRRAHQADLQQSNACNPFIEKSKKMIRDLAK